MEYAWIYVVARWSRGIEDEGYRARVRTISRYDVTTGNTTLGLILNTHDTITLHKIMSIVEVTCTTTNILCITIL